MKEKNVLEKYDEEIEGAKKKKFELGFGGKYNTDPEKQMDEIRKQLREQSHSLGGVSLNPINEYLTPQEAAVSSLSLLFMYRYLHISFVFYMFICISFLNIMYIYYWWIHL